MVKKAGLARPRRRRFPTGKKWKFCRKQPGAEKYLICNADEGDPGAFMDRAVGESDPHRLLEGMIIAAYAIGATKAYIYIRAEYPLAIEQLKTAIAQARGVRAARATTSSTAASTWTSIIKMGAGAFVCGEETALIHCIEGKRGMPRPRPPFPAQSGLFGKPTVINNVETLANLPLIIEPRRGLVRRDGHARSKGTKVFALSGMVNSTGPGRGADGHDAAPGRVRHRRRHPRRQEVQGRADRRPFGRLRARAAAGHADRLRSAQELRHDHGLGRPGGGGRDHLHGGLRQVLHGVHPERVLRQVHPVPRRHAADAGDPPGHHAAAAQGGRTSTRCCGSRASCT